MNNGFVLLGKFKGKFRTNQSLDIGAGDSYPHDTSHQVRLYQGKLTETKFFNNFQPENYAQLKSYHFYNAPNIEIDGHEQGGFNDKRVYSFKHLVLIDPHIVKTHNIDGITYGEVVGEAYGQTEPNPQIKRFEPGLISTPTKKPRKPSKGDGFGDTGFNEETFLGGATQEVINWFDQIRKGCLSNIWRLIGMILLILLLYWIFRSCESIENDNSCKDRNHFKRIMLKEQRYLDSLKKIYDINFPNLMASISTVYFYENSTEISNYSYLTKNGEDPGEYGNLKELLDVMLTFEDRKFIIKGFRDPTEIEDIDVKRAENIKTFFITNGVNLNRIQSIGGGIQHEDLENNSKSYFTNYESKEFNRNMKVVVELMANE